MALQPFFGPWPLFQFINLYTGSLDKGSALRKATAYTQNNTNRINAQQTLMSRMGFEPTIPVFERAKTLHAFDRAANSIGSYSRVMLLLVFSFYVFPLVFLSMTP
jgi:hypothetical protein